MYVDELYHHGVKGMKWGVRKSKPSSSSTTKKKQTLVSKVTKKIQSKKTKKNQPKTKVKVKDLTDSQLQKKINRLQMEKRYRDLKKDELSAGRKLIGDILMTSGKTIGIQLVNYGLGTGINKLMGAEVINIKSNDKKKDKETKKAA